MHCQNCSTRVPHGSSHCRSPEPQVISSAACDSKDPLLLMDMLLDDQNLRTLLNRPCMSPWKEEISLLRWTEWILMKEQMWGGAQVSTQERMCRALRRYQGKRWQEVGVWKWPNQAMALSRGGQIPVRMTPREREICHRLPQAVCPVPQHRSSLLCRLALFLVFLWAPSSRAGWKADGGILVSLELKAQALPAVLGTLQHPQPLCHLCLGWIFKKKIPALSEQAYIALVLVKLLTLLSWNLRPRRQRISYS